MLEMNVYTQTHTHTHTKYTKLYKVGSDNSGTALCKLRE